MLLKKQTVWLLTMLSLVVVLSVYYVTTPSSQNGEDVAYEEELTESAGNDDVETTAEDKDANKDQQENSDPEVTIEEAEDGSVISAIASDEVFSALRLEIDEYRSKVKADLQETIASKDVTAEQKNNASEQLKQLEKLESQEKMLEILIKGKGYEDALVRADGGKVQISVKTSEDSSKTAANELMRLVRSEMENIKNVAVQFDKAE